MGVVEDAHKAANPSFFKEVHDDASNNWYKGMIGQICVAKFEEARLSGEAVQKQASPIYREHREAISRQLRLQGDILPTSKLRDPNEWVVCWATW